MGLSFQLFSGLASSQTMALFTPQYPHPPTIPNALNVLEVARVTGCRIFATVPTFLEVRILRVLIPAQIDLYAQAWVHSPEAIEFLATMHVVVRISRDNVSSRFPVFTYDCQIFGGGPIARATGDKLVSGGVNIHSVYGATEIVGCCLLYESAVLQPTQDWEWLSFAPWLNIRWVPQGDDTYEFQVLVSEQLCLPSCNLIGRLRRTIASILQWRTYPTCVDTRQRTCSCVTPRIRTCGRCKSLF